MVSESPHQPLLWSSVEAPRLESVWGLLLQEQILSSAPAQPSDLWSQHHHPAHTSCCSHDHQATIQYPAFRAAANLCRRLGGRVRPAVPAPVPPATSAHLSIPTATARHSARSGAAMLKSRPARQPHAVPAPVGNPISRRGTRLAPALWAPAAADAAVSSAALVEEKLHLQDRSHPAASPILLQIDSQLVQPVPQKQCGLDGSALQRRLHCFCLDGIRVQSAGMRDALPAWLHQHQRPARRDDCSCCCSSLLDFTTYATSMRSSLTSGREFLRNNCYWLTV
mmetsp:Transcript_67319/g.161407  ORF Transcript_67319/g.161407 Transcript_67319/m.161407 type:complete len:281 (+) Transcript_67319:259-1101(+)